MMRDEDRHRFDLLERAADRRQVLEIAYRDAEGAATARRIRPLGLWFWGKVWTLVAWCELRTDFRAFRLDRMDEIRETGEGFRPERGRTLADYYRRMERDTPPADRERYV